MTDSLLMHENFPLKELSTFGVGGKARYLIEVKAEEQLAKALLFSKEKGLPLFVFGKGSNCLFADEGLNAVVVVNKIDHLTKDGKGLYTVGAGYSFSRLGTVTAKEGWSGLEFAAGIPGSVGGAVYMNAGANGQETADVLISVRYMDLAGTVSLYKKSQLKFHYRGSSFQERSGIILEATFSLLPLQEARDKQIKILDYRIKTQPYGEKSAGCVFANPHNNHAGALIEKAGLKGYQIGGAAVSPQHANFIINKNDATAKDILKLIKHIRKEIRQQFDITLNTEVRYISDEHL